MAIKNSILFNYTAINTATHKYYENISNILAIYLQYNILNLLQLKGL